MNGSSTQPEVTRISGPIVGAVGMRAVKMYEVVEVGPDRLVGEVIRLEEDRGTIQVYENTAGLKPSDPVYPTGSLLSVKLGPGLLGAIFDGIQRPLDVIAARRGAFIPRGEKAEPLNVERKWVYTPDPKVKAGAPALPGMFLGTLPETQLIEHRVMVPPDCRGTFVRVAPAGEYTIKDEIAVVRTESGQERTLTLCHDWSSRTPRPYTTRLAVDTPLVTGLRVIDTFFPVAKGGAAMIPGGFGTGKTMTQHSLAKWSDADVIVYIGCGERGNEMADVLETFPQLTDPRSGRPLMERTIMIANTSNMPVAAREVSIYTGITLAEYYRDMGYDVAVMADSTSRWAEALRELSGRLEEMPAEEGYPAYLPTRLAQFYERAGSTTTLAGGNGSVTIVGAVSPMGGDFSEPITQHTRRFIRCFWALDSTLANARHYPAIHWLRSYSEYVDEVAAWWQNIDAEWPQLRAKAIDTLQKEDRLQQIVKLVGPDVLPDSQRLVLFAAELLKDGFLAQNAFDAVDMYSIPAKQVHLLRILLMIHERGAQAIEAGAALHQVTHLPCMQKVLRAKLTVPNDQLTQLVALEREVRDQFDGLIKEFA